MTPTIGSSSQSHNLTFNFNLIIGNTAAGYDVLKPHQALCQEARHTLRSFLILKIST